MELSKIEPTTRSEDPRRPEGVGLRSRNERKEKGSGHASKMGEEWANIPCPWPKPGDGVVYRYATHGRVGREGGRECAYGRPATFDVRWLRRERRGSKASSRSKTKGKR